MEGLTKSEANLTVYVHPSKANNVRQTILRQLSSLLFKYDEIFEGIILAYEVNVQGKTGKILPGMSPYFGVKAKANLLIFSPRPNMLLEGKVVKLGKESIHAIVLGFSSAAIMSEDIRKEFKHTMKDDAGVFASKRHKRHVIKVGSVIRFLVKSFDDEILHFSGSLMDRNTGCVRWLFDHGVEDGPQIESSMKRHRNRDNQEETRQDLGLEEDQSVNPRRQHKSRKRSADT